LLYGLFLWIISTIIILFNSNLTERVDSLKYLEEWIVRYTFDNRYI